jgi:mannosyltransferase
MARSKPGTRFPMQVRSTYAEFLAIVGLTLVCVFVRFWMIGSKGLWYDEALTALMARATPGEIVEFQRQTAFAHPPLWILFMHYWSKLFGQSEVSLRIPAAITGALAVPMIWRIAKACWPGDRASPMLAAGLTAFSPILVLYSQEARMYSVVTLLALASVYLSMCVAVRPAALSLIGFVLTNWLMSGLHYYSVLLLGVESIFLLAVTLRERRTFVAVVVGLVLSVLPLALWTLTSPGLLATVGILSEETVQSQPNLISFLDTTWKDLSFGSVRWQPDKALLGYLLLPLLGVGVVSVLWPDRPPEVSRKWISPSRWGVYLVMIAFIPLAASLVFSKTIATRYILFVSPFVYALVAFGITRLWRLAYPLGITGLLAAGLVAGGGLYYYFGSYQKSEYREMANYLEGHAKPGEAILLEGPRQHILSKYYFPAWLDVMPIPAVSLPEHWSITAPPVVPEEADHQLQMILDDRQVAWLVLAGEDEVDPGEFVERYLTAIAYPEDCRSWLDVRLCKFVNPTDVSVAASIPLRVTFAGGMELLEGQIGLGQTDDRERPLLVSARWHAYTEPNADYKVTLRLLGPDGAVVSQSDRFPIGPLLPPTTWNAGDEKPGYMVLEIPQTAAPGEYDLAIGLYDPASLQLMPFSGALMQFADLVKLASVKIDSAGSVSIVQ